MDEPKSYLILDKIGPRLRAFTSLLLIFAGFVLQIGTKNILVGMPFMIACVLLNAIRGVSVKKVTPDTLAWEAVTMKKNDEVVEHCRSVRQFRSGRAGCCLGMVVIAIFAVVFVSPLIEWSAFPFPVMATVVNAFLLTAGLVLGGRRSAWMPRRPSGTEAGTCRCRTGGTCPPWWSARRSFAACSPRKAQRGKPEIRSAFGVLAR